MLQQNTKPLTTEVVMIKKTGMFITVLVFLAMSTSAQAMCAYNRSIFEMDVYFECGIFCVNEWSLNPESGKKCRPDEGGEVTYTYSKDRVDHEAKVKVDEHGYTITRGAWDNLELCSWTEDGEIKECVYFHKRH
jgi:hypothetical protein